MWTHVQLKGKRWKGQAYEVRQYKEDGWRATVFKQPDGTVKIFGRRQEKDLEFLGRFPRLHKDLKELFKAMPKKTSVDMEICAGTGVRESVITALKDPVLPLRFVAFAVPFFNGIDRRRESIRYAEQVVKRWNVIDFAYWEPGPLDERYRHVKEHSEALVRSALKLGIEGWMLKAGGQYGEWWKVKVEPTIDCVVMGTVPGKKGKYEGMVGALRLGLYPKRILVRKAVSLKEVATASGMNDEQRHEMTRMDQNGSLQGRVAEVQFQRVGSGGRLLHPRFVRWREDKHSKDCLLDQLKEGE